MRTRKKRRSEGEGRGERGREERKRRERNAGRGRERETSLWREEERGWQRSTKGERLRGGGESADRKSVV